jgi:hypothetical protein
MKVKQTMIIGAIALVMFLLGAATHVDLGIAVGAPPPPVPADVVVGPVGVAPGPGYVWVDGYWDWVGGRWVWMPGRWVLPPRRDLVWVGPVVDFRLHRGHWR